MTQLTPRYLHGTTVLGATTTGGGTSAPNMQPPAGAGAQSQWDTLYDKVYDRATGDFEVVEQTVKRIHTRISPWLWVFSIWGAFGTSVAVWNKVEQLRARGWRVW